MPFTCSHPGDDEGKVIGNGQCVAYVRKCTGAPQTGLWRPGVKVHGAEQIEFGTAIATFVDGSYPDKPTGQHAAIYVEQDATGITVWDQWVRQPVHKRLIRFKNGAGSLSNDGDAFSVIEVADSNPGIDRGMSRADS